MATNAEKGICPCECECGLECLTATCPCAECRANDAAIRKLRESLTKGYRGDTHPGGGSSADARIADQNMLSEDYV